MYSLIIIGAGPSGIALAVEARAAGVADKDILILEEAVQHSWVVRSLYPDDKLVASNYRDFDTICHGLLCMPDCDKPESLVHLEDALHATGVEVRYEEEVTKVTHELEGSNNRLTVHTTKGNYVSENVAVCIGIFGSPNKPSYELPTKLRRKVHYDVTSFDATEDHILVVGGGDSASENMIHLLKKGNKMDLSYRRDSFHRMNPLNEKNIWDIENNPDVNLWLNSNIKEVTISENKKPVVHFEKIGEKTYDRIVYALGGTTPQNFLKLMGITFSKGTPDYDEFGETGIKGLFLCGDLVAGRTGGSIILAFNSARRTIEALCQRYLTDYKVNEIKIIED